MLLYGLDIWHVSWLHMHMHMHMNMRPSVNKSSPNTTHMKSVFSARDRVRLAKLQSPRLRPCWLLQKIHVQRHPWRDHIWARCVGPAVSEPHGPVWSVLEGMLTVRTLRNPTRRSKRTKPAPYTL
jgi:hypothetical protein